VRPSALAVLGLIANSNFVGSSTGRALGFSPFRMRATRKRWWSNINRTHQCDRLRLLLHPSKPNAKAMADFKARWVGTYTLPNSLIG
jgi:hypothetical protein